MPSGLPAEFRFRGTDSWRIRMVEHLSHSSRRRFLSEFGGGLAALSLAAATGESIAQLPVSGSKSQTAVKPARNQVMVKVISSINGLETTRLAYQRIVAGADPLEAVVAGVAIVEDDPNDMTVGYGGLPNEEGVVELDAAVMHGPTHRAGAVAALRNIKNPAQVARLVMEQTDHVLLVGEGALKFARAQGFKEQDLLTDQRARSGFTGSKPVAKKTTGSRRPMINSTRP